MSKLLQAVYLLTIGKEFSCVVGGSAKHVNRCFKVDRLSNAARRMRPSQSRMGQSRSKETVTKQLPDLRSSRVARIRFGEPSEIVAQFFKRIALGAPIAESIRDRDDL